MHTIDIVDIRVIPNEDNPDNIEYNGISQQTPNQFGMNDLYLFFMNGIQLQSQQTNGNQTNQIMGQRIPNRQLQCQTLVFIFTIDIGNISQHSQHFTKVRTFSCDNVFILSKIFHHSNALLR